MTFYNIIFGILFLGAVKTMVMRVIAWNPPLFLEAATLCLLVFSDVIFTSHMIEELKKPYKVWMKMTDLLSFLLLTGAALATNPGAENLLGIDASKRLTEQYREPVFWGLISLYMFCLFLWNALCGTYQNFSKKHDKHLLVQPGLAVLFLVMFAASWSPDGFLTSPLRWATFLVTALYLLIHKTWLMGRVTIKRLAAADAVAIEDWPPYPKAFASLDYALRHPDGWLHQFPESAENRRYAAWRGSELVGFSLLAHTKDGEAEFYVAVHPELLHKGIGRAITEQTVAAGFEQLGLSRIYLKVRDWHTGAARLYESVGFQKYGEAEELIQGKPTKFVMMQIRRPNG